MTDIRLVGENWHRFENTIHQDVEIDHDGDIKLETHPTLREVGQELGLAYAWCPGVGRNQTYEVIERSEEKKVNESKSFKIEVTVEGVQELYQTLEALDDYLDLNTLKVTTN